MRIVIIGISILSVCATKKFLDKGCEIIIVEGDEKKIEEYSQELDCSFIKGDATQPSVLKETDPKKTDILLCLTEHDQNNIICGLVGKSLGFKKVYISISNHDWEKICNEVGLNETIVPVDIISEYLDDISEGHDTYKFRQLVKNDMELFSFIASEKESGHVKNLKFPSDTKVVWIYRNKKFIFVDETTVIKKDDEVVIATNQKHLEKLKEQFRHEKKQKN